MPSAMGNQGLRSVHAESLARAALPQWRRLHALDDGMMYALPANDADLWRTLKDANAHLIYDGVGCLVGGFTLTRINDRIGTFGLIVDPAVRGRGYGKKIVELVEERAATMGLLTLRVDVYTANTPARELFAASGYRDFVWLEKNIKSTTCNNRTISRQE